MTENEEWRHVATKGFEDLYEVSSLGRVRRIETGRILKPIVDQHFGHLAVTLSRRPVQRRAFIHRLVAAAFLGPRPDGMHTCHTNGLKTDNRIENLRYDTPKGNSEDRVRQGHVPPRWTHCAKGHPLSGENEGHMKNGRHYCKECARAVATRANHRKRGVPRAQSITS